MSTCNKTREFWLGHLSQLKKWDKSTAEYARSHNIKKSTLGYWIAKLKEEQDTQTEGSSKFIPIIVKDPVYKNLSIKITTNKIICELEGLSLIEIKELIISIGDKK